MTTVITVAAVAIINEVMNLMGILASRNAIRYPSNEGFAGRAKALLNISLLVLNDDINTQIKGAIEIKSTIAKIKYVKT
jgi:hypothetical protein